MAINRPLVLTWKNIEYTVYITMRLIDRIEGELNINLMKMVGQNTINDVRYSQAAKLIAYLLTVGGAGNITPDEVFDDMFSGEDCSIDPSELSDLLWEIFAVIFPAPKKKSPKKRKRSKRTHGTTTTK